MELIQARRHIWPALGGRSTTLLAILLQAVLVPTLAAAQETPKPASIRGRVVSRHGEPIAGAEATIVGGEGLPAVTDSSGWFNLPGIPPGVLVLRIRRIGFTPQNLRLNLDSGTVSTLEIMLDPGPQLLPDLTVSAKEAKPVEFSWTTKYDDFFRRRALGLPGGTFVGAEDIRRRPAMHTAELLEQYVPGLRAVQHFPGEGGTEIVFPRCSRATGYVGVWVDGKRFHPGGGYMQVADAGPRFDKQAKQAAIQKAREVSAQLADLLNLIPPSEIQFVEVYRGIGSIPAEFAGGCGAVAIWTK